MPVVINSRIANRTPPFSCLRQVTLASAWLPQGFAFLLRLIAEDTSSTISLMVQMDRTSMTIRKGEATAILKIRGMDNSGRAQQLRRAADRLDGVLRVDINYISDTATVKYDADKLTLAQVAEPIRGISSRGPVRTGKYVQGKRGKGEISRSSRRRGRYSRTQRGRLGE